MSFAMDYIALIVRPYRSLIGVFLIVLAGFAFCVLCQSPAFPQSRAECETCRVSDPGVPNEGSTEHSSPAGNAADDRDAWTIRSRAVEVTVLFAVTKGHKSVNDLTQNEVNVLDDNKPVVKISAFGHQSDLPLRLGLLIDTSDSVSQRFKFEQQASTRFLQKMIRLEKDRAFVMGFAAEPHLTQDYTDDGGKLAAGVSALKPDGETSLFDAVRVSCLKLAETANLGPASRILVLISDGDDNSSKITLQQAIETAQRTQVTIYTISTNDIANLTQGDRNLKTLAKQTGGEIFWPGNAENTVKAFDSLEKDMRSRYALSSQPADSVEDGRFHRIEIKAQRAKKKFKVYARQGYYASAKNPSQADCMGSAPGSECSENGALVPRR
jgi:Ca-activated chloride channel homolog